MMRNAKTMALMLALTTSQTFAHWVPVVTSVVGANKNNLGLSQTILLTEFPNTYLNNPNKTTRTIWGFFAGMDYHRHTDKFTLVKDRVQYQVGIGVYQNEAATVSGIINEFGLPEFNNLNYRLYVRSRYVLAEGRVYYRFFDWFMPFVMGGLGGSSNKAHNYIETPRIDTAVPMLPFSNNSTNAIAYTVGAGFDINVTQNLRAGLSYRYADLGTARLGLSPAQSTQNTFQVGKVNSHQLMFRLSAVA
jgi:opacity protein-like surface antigen